MTLRALTEALTLYRSGTYTFEQAAARVGRSDEEFEAALERFGVDRREAQTESSERTVLVR